MPTKEYELIAGFIYIIGSYENLEMVKVGRTVNLLRRLSEIQTSNPFLMVLHASYPIDNLHRLQRVEAGVHEKMKNYKIHGEWFNIHPQEASRLVSDYIASQDKRSRKKSIERGLTLSPGRGFPPCSSAPRPTCRGDVLPHLPGFFIWR